MLNQRPQFDVVEKFKTIRSIYDKVFITIAGSLWIFSTLWDIYNLQRFWLDYTLEFYSSFFVFYMIIFSIYPKSLPKIIYNNFRIITTIRGRGTLLIIISSLFIKDNHTFHKFCAILFFLGGIVYFICEILVPTTKEELDQIESMFNNNNIQNQNVKLSQITETANSNIKIDQSTEVFNNKENSGVINNNIENNNEIIKESEKKENSNNENINGENENRDSKEEEKGENKIDENDINNNIISEEVVRKTDNPYEIPDDF